MVKRGYCVTRIAVILSGWLLVCAAGAWGRTGIDQPRPADIRLVIDVSGSMKKNDPGNLRQPAVGLLVKLLPDGSKAGIWTFGEGVSELVPHEAVTDSWKRRASASAEQIDSRDMYTNIGQALEKTLYDLNLPDTNYQTSVIMLTDGMVDISKDPKANEAEWRRIVDELLPDIASAPYTLHTISLSENADTALMDKLALATGGMSEMAQSADDLMSVFLKVFDQAAPSEQVPLEGNEFLVDSSIEEFSALIFRQPGAQPTRLIAPDGKEYAFGNFDEDLEWHQTDDYDLITLQQPLEGEWRVVADIAPDSRVTVVSNLKLLVKPLPTNLFIDDTATLSLLFQEQERTLTQRDFLRLLDIESRVGSETSGQEWTDQLSAGGPPADGIYTQELNMFSEEGKFTVRVDVDGKSFRRQFTHHLTVRKPFVVDVNSQNVEGSEQFLISVRSFSATIDPSQVQAVARIRDPSGRSSIQPMPLSPTDDWQLLYKPEQEGKYQVRVRISGTDRSGAPFSFDPGTQEFTFPSGGNPFGPVEESSPPVEDAPIQPAPEPQAEAEDALGEEDALPMEEEEESGSSSMPLYIGLAVGNLFLVALAWFAYRMLMGKTKEEEELEEEASATEEPAPAEPAPEPEEPEEPMMAPIDEDDDLEPEPAAVEDMPLSDVDDDLEEEIRPIELDASDIPMDDGMDLEDEEALPDTESSDFDDILAEMEQATSDMGAADDLDDDVGEALDQPLDDVADDNSELFDEASTDGDADASGGEETVAEEFSMDEFLSDDDEEDDEENKSA